MRLNKVICDKCKKELEVGTEVRLDISKKQTNKNRYSNALCKY